MYGIKRTDEEIDDVRDQACLAVEEDGSKFPGMSYEQGLEEMIRWLTDDSPGGSPMDD